MQTKASDDGKLALFGGPAAGADVPTPEWPPRSDETANRLLEIYRSGNWGFGMAPDLDQFSRDFATKHDCRYGVFMANGTLTLMCALHVNGIGPGDEVIVPAYTWLATATAVKYVGAKIVFVDSEATTLCMDPARVEEAITARTKAIIPVHFMGSTVDMDAIMAIARRRKLLVIEDCAQAHGAKCDGRRVGAIGHVGSFSFQHNKIMSSGEGGICTTNDEAMAERLYRMAYIGYKPGERFGNFKSPPPTGLTCYNFRGTQFHAVILAEQLEQLDVRVAKQWSNARRLITHLAGVPGVRVQSPGRAADPQSYYKLGVVFDGEPLRDIPIDVIRRALNAEGFPFQPSYGTVPGHLLFNLEESRDYVMPAGGIPIAKSIGAERVVMLSHQWLGSDSSVVEKLALAIRKLAANAVPLRNAPPA